MVKKLCLAALFLTVSATASAGKRHKHECGDNADAWGPQAVCAPELDPTAAFAGLALALGGLAVLRGRRVKPTES
jgi:hypothetical protein